jgi:glycosyltransferase involved in cell wall biosynthesis
MKNRGRMPLVVDVGPLRESYYTGIPNVIAEICSRLLCEDWLELYFVLDGYWIDKERIARCVAERSGLSLGGQEDAYPPADTIRTILEASGALRQTVALYTDHRPPRKLYSWEGKIVYDLSMILAPECHPTTSVARYTSDLAEQIAASDVLFPISESTARDLTWIYGVGPERLKVALLGHNVDLTASARIREIIGNRPVEPFLLVLGSIEPRKNTALVLEWLSRQPDVIEKVRVVFAGREAWGDSFTSLIESKSLQGAAGSGRIVFAGFVDEKFRTALLTAAAGLIYPSIFEGFGLPLLEAMATGTPVLSSVSTSMPEVVGDCGYYFDPCSIESLHSAFLRLWSDRQSGVVGQLVARARQRANIFSYDATYRVIIKGLFPTIATATEVTNDCPEGPLAQPSFSG